MGFQMGTERENLELEAARVRLERERLALAREQRAAERPAKAAATAREVVRGGVAAAEVAKAPLLAGLFFFGRLTGWLLLWFLLLVGTAALARNWPAYDQLDYVQRLDALLVATGPLAMVLIPVYAFIRWRGPVGVASVVALTALAAWGFHATIGFRAPETPLKLGPISSPAPASRPVATGQYFSGDCRRMDQSPAEAAAYDEQVRIIERQHPALNPEHSQYRQDLEEKVVTRMEAMQRTGLSRCVAARLAAEEVMAGR